MGSCSSVHRRHHHHQQEPTTTTMKLRLSFESKNDSPVIPPSPIKDNNNNKNPQNGNFLQLHDGVVALKSQWSPSKSTTTTLDNNTGSKEEAFFDSKAWLDSDCEDDFYSVNGEFTPSRGPTPVHHTFGTPVINKITPENTIPVSAPVSSPTERKKLLELFRESVREDKEDDEAGNPSGNEKNEPKPIIQDRISKSARSTPYISGPNSACSSERTMNEEDQACIRDKSVKSKQCCLPSLVSCRSFSERRRKASPAIAANGKA